MTDYSQRLAELSPDLRALLALNNPLSYGQQRLWFLNRLNPDSPVYNIPAAFRLEGRLDIASLERALNAIIERHEILRTSFETVDGQPLQIVSPSIHFKIPQTDLSHLPESEREAEARKLATEDAWLPFDLKRSPLLRARLLKLGESEHVALFTLHHIISDGWSSGVFLSELAALYKPFSDDAPPELPGLPIQYADFAQWERDWAQSGGLDAQLSYWKQQLEGCPSLLELGPARPRPPVQTNNGARQEARLSREIIEPLKELSRQQHVTLFTTLLAAFQTLLGKYSGQDDIIVGTPVANRSLVETEGLIGFFVNTLAMRTRLDGNPTFIDLIQRTREVTLGAYANQQLPFDKLVEELLPERNLSHSPLFQVLFDLQNVPQQPLKLAGLKPSILEFENSTTKFDLALSLQQQGDELGGTLQYNVDLFDSSTIARLLEHFRNLLVEIGANPQKRLSEFDVMNDAERRMVLSEWNRTDTDFSAEKCIHEIIEEQAARRPEATAVKFEQQELSYKDLNARANQLARHLRKLGLGPDQLAAVFMERSPEMIVAWLGILKAGAAYVPIDPAYPKERIAYMLADSNASALLTQKALAEFLSESNAQVICLDREENEFSSEDTSNLEINVTPDNLAYMIYTSGSTGKPKGALIAHRGLCNLSQAQMATFDLNETKRVLQFSSFSFDAATFEIVMALAVGATLCMATRDVLLPGASLMKLLADEAVTNITIPPSALTLLPAEALPDLKTIIVAGEACPPSLVARWADGRRFFNAYGPTETTVWATISECADGERKPNIGRPIDNTKTYILDSHFNPVPIGVPGELFISGAGLSRGYRNRPDLTARSFVPNPFGDQSGARLYKTGDLCRYSETGEIEFLRRADHQVKIRGFRIELEEIETLLAQPREVQAAAVIVREDEPGDKRIVAYVVPASEGEMQTGQLRSFLAERLPDYMIPSAFVVIESLPQTPNGKLDQKALPAPDQSRPDLNIPFFAPSTRAEETLASIWADALKLDLVGIDDNFFELGGHSLLAVKVHERISKAFSTDIPLLRLFQYPTVRTLARFLDTEQESQSSTLEKEQDWAEKRKQALRRQRQMRS